MQVGDAKIGNSNLQSCLKKLGYFHNSITGKYDLLTKEAVSNLQLKNHLPVVEFLDMPTFRVIQKKCYVATIYMPLIGSNYGNAADLGIGDVSHIRFADPIRIRPNIASATRNFNQPARNYLTIGDSGKNVKAVQERLLQIGFFNANPDGYFGENTRSYVYAFQQYSRLNPTGIVDPQTWQALGLNTSPLENRANTNRYVVVVPIQNADTLNKIRQYIPNPVVEKSGLGDYINAGSYHDRLLAESVVRLLRTRNIDARVQYF